MAGKVNLLRRNPIAIDGNRANPASVKPLATSGLDLILYRIGVAFKHIPDAILAAAKLGVPAFKNLAPCGFDLFRVLFGILLFLRNALLIFGDALCFQLRPILRGLLFHDLCPGPFSAAAAGIANFPGHYPLVGLACAAAAGTSPIMVNLGAILIGPDVNRFHFVSPPSELRVFPLIPIINI